MHVDYCAVYPVAPVNTTKCYLSYFSSDPHINSVKNFFYGLVLLCEHRFNLLMASMKYDVPLLDHDTKFTRWQVEMRALLAQANYQDALSFSSRWSFEDYGPSG